MLHHTALPLILVTRKCNCYNLTCGFKLFDLPLVPLRLFVSGLECQVKFFRASTHPETCAAVFMHSFIDNGRIHYWYRINGYTT